MTKKTKAGKKAKKASKKTRARSGSTSGTKSLNEREADEIIAPVVRAVEEIIEEGVRKAGKMIRRAEKVMKRAEKAAEEIA
ncbi:MAG TPA: hypothetical protein ENI85_03770, partial [Deltaproteobacteria bacterium]|nr:hypothetical protein [Deltaproteobacteria bacterium]